MFHEEPLAKREDVMVTDPVCQMRIDEKTAPAQTSHQGTILHFCSTRCKERFDASPERFLRNSEEMTAGKTPSFLPRRQDLKRVDLPISGMSCASCAARIEKGLSRMNGISEVKVNLATEKALVSSTSPISV